MSLRGALTRVLDFDRARFLQALTYLVIVLFLAGGFVSARYRRGLRWVTIGLYLAAVAMVLVWIGLWLAG